MTNILCTKSPKRFKYADILEGPLVFDSPSGSAMVDASSLSDLRARRPSPELRGSAPDAVAVEDSAGAECECE